MVSRHSSKICSNCNFTRNILEFLFQKRFKLFSLQFHEIFLIQFYTHFSGSLFQFHNAFNPHAINVTQVNDLHSTQVLPDIPGSGNFLREIIEVRSDAATPIYVLFIHAASSYLSYIIGKFACRINIQGFSFAFPVILTVPLTVTGLITIVYFAYCKQICERILFL